MVINVGQDVLTGGKVTQSRAAIVGMAIAGVVGATFNWPWWLEYVCVAPFALWLIISARLVVYRQLKPGSSDRRVPVALVTIVMLAAAIRPTRYSGLVVVIAFVVVYIFSRTVQGNAKTAS
jgi:hypothetical protein